jgi:hypothetical protein
MFAGDYVCLPKDIVIEYKDEHSIDHLIDCVFPNLNKNACSTQYMREHGILCTRNDYVDEINARMIDRFPGKVTVFYSFDLVDDDERNNYPQDFLNSITPNGLPPHKRRIKINCPLILLRNLDQHSGLCNRTHLVVKAVDKHILDAEIVNGIHAGDRVFIPRIPLSPSEDLSLPFKFKRQLFLMRHRTVAHCVLTVLRPSSPLPRMPHLPTFALCRLVPTLDFSLAHCTKDGIVENRRGKLIPKIRSNQIRNELEVISKSHTVTTVHHSSLPSRILSPIK